MTAGQREKQEWVAGLAALEPDLVVDTGDNLAGLDAVPPTLKALSPLLDFPGAFVTSSNDYFAPRPKNPLKYFRKNHKRVHGVKLPWRDLRDGLVDGGWLNLTNARGELTVDGRRISFAGLDDPHLKLDRYEKVAGPADPTADLRIGVVHAPEPRVLDRFAADGYALLLCGHTHGRPVRVAPCGGPGPNCRIPPGQAPRPHPLPRPRRQGPLAARLDAAVGGAPERHVAARLGRTGHQPLRAGALRLPAGGHAAHPDRAGALAPPEVARRRALDSSGTSGCGAAW